VAEDLRQRIGGVIVRGRRILGWSQRRLAAETRVSQTAVALAERGEGGSVEVLEHLLRAVGARAIVQEPTVVDPSGSVGTVASGGSDLLHRTGVGTMRRLFERAGMAVATEQPIVDGQLRSWIDVLAYQESIARLVVTEMKSELRDLGGTQRQVERYARSALQPARALGWRPKEIVVALVVLATEDADAFVSANRAELAAAFPMRGRAAVSAMLDGGPLQGRALLALDPFRVGRHALTSLRVDGRRQPFQFVHPWELRRAIEERDRHRRRGSRS
jgi:transcriptional regulator with XRE-family HTH domain